MQIKIPKDSRKYHWTNHVIDKMRYYGISESSVIRTIRHSTRIEEGIAPDTIGAMYSSGSKKHPYEIWVLYQPSVESKRLVIISSWKYPGRSPTNKPIPIPDELRIEIEEIIAKNN